MKIKVSHLKLDMMNQMHKVNICYTCRHRQQKQGVSPPKILSDGIPPQKKKIPSTKKNRTEKSREGKKNQEKESKIKKSSKITHRQGGNPNVLVPIPRLHFFFKLLPPLVIGLGLQYWVLSLFFVVETIEFIPVINYPPS